jgi:hypothetical protein
MKNLVKNCISVLLLLSCSCCALLGIPENISESYSDYISCRELTLDASNVWACNVKKDSNWEGAHIFSKRAKLILDVKPKDYTPTDDDQCMRLEAGTPLKLEKVIRYWDGSNIAFGQVYDNHHKSFHNFEYSWGSSYAPGHEDAFYFRFVPWICPEQWKK